jgi:hypothetical protein
MDREGPNSLPGYLAELMSRPGVGVARVGRALRRVTARVPSDPVLVFGNQKAGTSAIAGLLGLATDLSTCIDLPRANRRAMYGPLRRGEMTFNRFVQLNRESFAHRIIKEPNLTPFMDDVRGRFPRARSVFIVRDPRDNIRSILNRLDLPGHLEELDPATLAATPGSWPLVLDGRWLGLDGATWIEQLADRWTLMVDAWRRHRADMVLVRYEDFMADRQTVIERLADQLGLPVRHDIAGDVDRSFQPRGDRDVDPLAFFGSRNLDRITRRCRGGMTELGYGADPGRAAEAAGAGHRGRTMQ